MTLPMLAAASQVVFLVVGEDEGRGRRPRVRGPARARDPASLLRSADGETIALLDRAAAAKLDNVS